MWYSWMDHHFSVGTDCERFTLIGLLSRQCDSSKPGGLQQLLLNNHNDLFSLTLGTMNNINASLTVQPSNIPVFAKARRFPYSMRDRVEAGID